MGMGTFWGLLNITAFENIFVGIPRAPSVTPCQRIFPTSNRPRCAYFLGHVAPIAVTVPDSKPDRKAPTRSPSADLSKGSPGSNNIVYSSNNEGSNSIQTLACPEQAPSQSLNVTSKHHGNKGAIRGFTTYQRHDVTMALSPIFKILNSFQRLPASSKTINPATLIIKPLNNLP